MRFRRFTRHAAVLLAISLAFAPVVSMASPPGTAITVRHRVSSALRRVVSSWSTVSAAQSRSVSSRGKCFDAVHATAVHIAGSQVLTDGCGNLLVRVHLAPGARVNQRALSSLGGKVAGDRVASYPIQVLWIPVGKVQALANLAFISSVSIRTPNRVQGWMARSSSSGHMDITALRALSENQANLKATGLENLIASGDTGFGVMVGVISNGDANLSQYQSWGDLPSTVNTVQVGSGDEGSWMMEVVHLAAPDAALAFCGAGAGGSQSSCANQLINAGANVLVDDLSNFYSPTNMDTWGSTPFSVPVRSLPLNGQSVVQYFNSSSHEGAAINAAGNYGGGFLQGYIKTIQGQIPAISGQQYTLIDFGKVAGGTSQPFIAVNAPSSMTASSTIYIDGRYNYQVSPAYLNGQTGQEWEFCTVYTSADGSQLLGTPQGTPSAPCQNPRPLYFGVSPPYSWTSGAYRVYVIVGQQGVLNAANTFLKYGGWFANDSGLHYQPIPLSPKTLGSADNDDGGLDPQAISVTALKGGSTTSLESFASGGPQVQWCGEAASSTGSSCVFNRKTLDKPDVASPDKWEVMFSPGYPGLFWGTSSAAPGVAAAVADLVSAGLPYSTIKSHWLAVNNTSSWNASLGLGAVSGQFLYESVNPTAGIVSISPSNPTAGSAVSFNGSCTAPSGGTASGASYTWNFGDGGDGTGQSTTHTYTSSGPYSVQLTCTDSTGKKSLSSTDSLTVQASGGGGNPGPGPGKTGSGGGSFGLIGIAVLCMLALCLAYLRRLQEKGLIGKRKEGTGRGGH